MHPLLSNRSFSTYARAARAQGGGGLRAVIATCCLVFSGAGLALETDKEAKVEWEAAGNSTMAISDGIRTLTMEDNVVVTQGSLRITGDKAVFEYSASNNEIQRITVEGSPVNYSQTLSNDGSSVTGTSTSLALYSDDAAQSIVELRGNASLNSPDSAMSCAAIVYLVDLDLIREATGPCSGSLDNTANN